MAGSFYVKTAFARLLSGHDEARATAACSFGGERRRHLYKFNADLVAAPPLDAGLASRGVERKQQGE